jgi:YfiH family protein
MSAPIEIIEADWPAPRGIVAGTTLRGGGVSEGAYDSLNLGAHVGDSPGNVTENRKRFMAQCRLPAEPLWLMQVHGTEIIVDPDPGHSLTADAILSTAPNTVCAVMTADCLPVLMVNSNGGEVAAAHAGWRGLCNGVLESTVRAFRSPPGQILAWLGPAISQENFEVGDDVLQAFVAHDAAAGACFLRNARGRWQADLYGLARQRLLAAGVHRVYGGGACTFADSERFFSYRRDGNCGRMASFVFRYSETP